MVMIESRELAAASGRHRAAGRRRRASRRERMRVTFERRRLAGASGRRADKLLLLASLARERGQTEDLARQLDACLGCALQPASLVCGQSVSTRSSWLLLLSLLLLETGSSRPTLASPLQCRGRARTRGQAHSAAIKPNQAQRTKVNS